MSLDKYIGIEIKGLCFFGNRKEGIGFGAKSNIENVFE